jgi:AraC-like DNA-binding protein
MEKIAYYLQIGTTTISMVFALVFVFYNWNKSLFKKLLALQFIILAFGLFINFIAFNNFFSLFPHLTRTGLLCALLIPPIQFIAIYKELKNQKLKWSDFFHVLPAILYIVNFYNYYTLSATEKIILIESNSLAKFNEGFLPPYFLPALSLAQTTFYLVWFGLLAKKLKTAISSKSLLRFFYFMMVNMIFHYLPTIMVILYYYDAHDITNWMPIIYGIANLFFFFKILATPEWLFYHKSNTIEPIIDPKITTVSKREISPLETELIAKLSPRKIHLTPEELRLFDNFTAIVEAERMFLEPSFCQKGVAEKLQVSEYKIRLILDKTYGIKFSEFINYRRTYFLLNEMHKNATWRRYSFVAIARKLGYLSTNSFYLNFKKISGVTPKEYFGPDKQA